jgi:DnaK suppressor protein
MPVKKTTKKAAKKPAIVKAAYSSMTPAKTNPKFDAYKKLLLSVKEKITGDIRNLSDDNKGSSNDRGGDVSGHALHMADVATDMYDREFTLGLAANERELLYQVDEALMRVQEGTYGICITCKKSIPVTRLKALPHAKLCMKCQEASEAKR